MSHTDSLPRIINAYVQVNLVKGYRYIDTAGELLNALADNYPIRNVTMEMMRLISQEEKIQEIRVGNEQIWLHFPQPESLDFVVDQSRKIIHIAADILGVQVFSRVAMRAEFLIGLTSPREQILLLQRRMFSDSMADYLEDGYPERMDKDMDRIGFEFTFPRTDGEYYIRLRLATVRYSEEQGTKEDKDSDLPKYGLVIDPDVASNLLVNRNQVRSILRAAARWMQENIPQVVHLLGTSGEVGIVNMPNSFGQRGT